MAEQEIIHGACEFALRDYPDGYFDACITDSPYGLRFMGNRWDYQVPSPKIWASLLRVMKPGAPLISFGGRRTYHRVAAAIEDGGFEIVDQMTWIFGGGFPKTKDSLKPAHDSICVARAPGGDELLLHDVEANRVGPRWPATIELSCACEGSRHEPACAVAMLDAESGELRSNNEGIVRRNVDSNRSTYGWFRGGEINLGSKYAGTGGASRFFYCSQARMGERAGNAHPTVKPLELVRRLVRLFSAPGARVLDPFAGSCTTALACQLEQRACTAIEREAEHVAVGRKRLSQGVLDFAEVPHG